MVDLNIQVFIVQMIGFLILLFILNFILYKPVLKVLGQRKSIIEDLIKEANEIKSKAMKTKEEYETSLLKAEETEKANYNKAVKEALQQKNEIIEKETKEARSQIEQYKKEVFELLEKEIESTQEYSVELSNKLYKQLVG